MTNGKVDCTSCPPAIKLQSVCKELEEIKLMDVRQWQEIDKRVKMGLLVIILSILITIVGGLFGAIWTQTSKIVDKVTDVRIGMGKIETELGIYRARPSRSHRPSRTNSNDEAGNE